MSRGTTELERQGEGAAQRGRVLRVKEGYNPNSSSIGSAISAYLAAAVGAGAVGVILLNLFSSAGGLLRRRLARERENEVDEEA
jgi:hypothetical protein